MPGLIQGAAPGSDTAVCNVATYYETLRGQMTPGNSLEIWEMYWRNTDVSAWLASNHGKRIPAARLKETLAAMAPRRTPLPVFDSVAAKASVAAAVADATARAGQNAAAENRRVTLFYQSIGQTLT